MWLDPTSERAFWKLHMFGAGICGSDANKVGRGKLNPNNAIKKTVPFIFSYSKFCFVFHKMLNTVKILEKIWSIS